MTAFRNTFIDPSGGRSSYDWAINHATEEEFGKTRSIEHSANTGNTGLVRQQNDDEPMVFQFQGTILSKAQYVEMWHWFKLCKSQTIHFVDFTGDKYEVIITSFKPTRHETIRNPRDYANAPLWFWKYDISMEVVSFIDTVIDFITP